MDEPQSAKRAFAEGIMVEFRNKDAFCISDNDMRDFAGTVNEHAYLPADF